MRYFIESAISAQLKRTALPFATIDLPSGKAVGSRYHHLAMEHRRLEIGVTWIATAHQRSYINTEAQLLQLWYALEILKFRRIELKADVKREITRGDFAAWRDGRGHFS